MPRVPKGSMRGGVVRLTLPARLANDLEGLQGSLRQLAERLGHPKCATGCDTLFLQLEREFVARAADKLDTQGGAVSLPTDPVPWKAVDVRLAEPVTRNIDSLQKAVAVTLGKLGCPACCSGFDIAFRRELDLITINENIEAQGFGAYR